MDYLLDFLGERDNILDLCCGPAIQMEYLISKGKYVVGVDSSEIMISLAHKKLKSTENCIHGDVETIKLDECFNMATFLFGSFVFPEMKKAKRILRKINSQLNDGGLLVIDNRNFSVMYDLLGTNNFIELDLHYELQEFDINSSNNVIITKTHYIFKNDSVKNSTVELLARYYSVAELKEMLEESGFKIEELYGDYDLSSYSYKYSQDR